jgi:hypothetical protein
MINFSKSKKPSMIMIEQLIKIKDSENPSLKLNRHATNKNATQFPRCNNPINLPKEDLNALDIEGIHFLLLRNIPIAVQIDKSLLAIEVDDLVAVLEETASRVVESVGELGGSALDGAEIVHGAALEKVAKVACQTVAEGGCASLAAGEVVADLEGYGGNVAGCDGWGCADGSGENGGNEGGGELHFEVGCLVGCLVVGELGCVDGRYWLDERRVGRVDWIDDEDVDDEKQL